VSAEKMIEMGGATCNITTNSAPRVRVHGNCARWICSLTAADRSRSVQRADRCAEAPLRGEPRTRFSFGLKNLARFRGNVFNQRGAVGAVFRTIPWEIKGFDALGLPQVVKNMCDKPRGLVAGDWANGLGKSTTLAAMLDKNQQRTRRAR